MICIMDVDIDNYQCVYQGVREGVKIFVLVYYDFVEVGCLLVYYDNKVELICFVNKVVGYMGGILVVSMNQSFYGCFYIVDFMIGLFILIEMGLICFYICDEWIVCCQFVVNVIVDFIVNNFL